MATQEAPPGDTRKADVLTSADNISIIELKSDEDLEQRKWFNMAMKKINQGGVNKVQCDVKEETRDTSHAELCNIFIHAIRTARAIGKSDTWPQNRPKAHFPSGASWLHLRPHTKTKNHYY